MIFVRHGQSIGNLTRHFYGQTDGALTDKGREQARVTAKHLENVHIDIAYASDLVRAYETGEIIAALHGLKPVPDTKLREIFAGDWEDMGFEDICVKYPETFDIWMNDIVNSTPDNGESVRHLAKRISDEVWRIAEENDGKTVLVAIHATPIRALECEWRGLPIESMNDISWVPNASVSIIDYDTKAHTVTPEVIGDASFMGDLVTTLPKNV